MGLDMYMYARKYISGKDYSEASRDVPWDSIPLTSAYQDATDLMPEGITKYAEYPSATVSVQVAYWRKANAVHGWFVKNCGDGVDECQEMDVDKSHLEQLLDDIYQVLARPGLREGKDNPIPPVGGFFFGNTEIDDYYTAELERTKEMVEHLLKYYDEQSGLGSTYFVYQASW